MKQQHKLRRPLAVLLVATLSALLAACGSDSDNATSDHNKQDVDFATDMIPHHAQAVQMSRMATTRASSAEVRTLAVQIEAAQQPEIDMMNGWLKAWGEKEIDANASAGTDHSTHGTSGMLSASEMNTLEKATGSAFDKLFLQGMIKHHEGAIDMAKTEQEKGKYEAAKTMANSIITSQQAEIDQMRKLLA